VSGFDGLIHVAKTGQQTVAYQESKVVLMEDGALHHGKPELEIFQDDVVCSHGAAIGHLDQNALFYLMSRGIAEEDARSMLLEAFFAGLVEAATPHMGALIPDADDVLSLAKGLA
jgi:ABC-type transport system involved in Fe-S cluster assembly, permease component